LFVWFFMTPILYPLSMAPDSFQTWMIFNPMYLFIDLYRQLLLQHEFSIIAFGHIALLSIAVFSLGGWFFMRVKHSFADVL
ncbi:MAG: ABC transporter permease, partial [Pseudomonadota bacterium]